MLYIDKGWLWYCYTLVIRTKQNYDPFSISILIIDYIHDIRCLFDHFADDKTQLFRLALATFMFINCSFSSLNEVELQNSLLHSEDKGWLSGIIYTGQCQNLVLL